MLKKIIKNGFIRNVILLISGTAGAQAISVICSPVITRIYGAEEFGILGVFTAVSGIMFPLVTLFYPLAIVLPKNDDDARGIVNLSVLLITLMSSISALILYFSGYNLVSWFNLELIKDYLMFIPLALFLIGMQQTIQQWAIRRNQFKIISTVVITQSIILNLSKISIGVFDPTAMTLITLTVLGSGLYAIQVFLYSNRNSLPNKKLNFSSANKTDITKIAKKYSDFPLYRAPQQLISAISQSLPTIFLAGSFGPAAAGFYNLGKMVLEMPLALIGKAVGDVFYPRIVKAEHNQEDLFKLIIKATMALTLVGVWPFIFIILFGPWLFSKVFGSEWIVAGEYARWLAGALFLTLLNRPCIAALPILKLQKFFLVYELVGLILRATALYIGYSIYEDAIIAVALFAAVGVCSNLFLIMRTLVASKMM